MVETLKGQHTSAGNKHNLRKAMVVFQISVFIVLIAVMALVQKQVHYAFNKDLGIEKEGLLRVSLGDHDYKLFCQEIRKKPECGSGERGIMDSAPQRKNAHVDPES